jgi:hypothetical protein
MKKTIFLISAIVFMFVFSLSAAWSQDNKSVAKKEAVAAPEDKEQAEILKKVDLFYQVVSDGEAQKNPLILIAAIRLFDSLPFTGLVKPAQDDKKDVSVYNRTVLLNEARQYAAGDTELLALLAKIENTPESTEVRGQYDRGGPGNYYRHGGGHNSGVYQGSRYADSRHGGGGYRVDRYDDVYYDGGHAQTCFIATAAYGSPLAERVDTLRRFRDQWLLKSNLGASFVDFYYQHSQPLAYAISKSSPARAVTRTFLYPITVIAGACLGQITDIIQVVLVFALLMAFIVLLWRRKTQHASS